MSEGACTVVAMATSAELLDVDWAKRVPRPGSPTGLRDLDSLTGGISPGELWVVIGTPGVGRTAFACQLALSAATTADRSVAFIAGRERSDSILANMASALGRVPAHHLLLGILTDDDRSRLDAASQQIAAARLHVLASQDDAWQFEHQTSIPQFDHLIGGRALADVLVVDDVDLLVDRPLRQCLRELRIWCAQTGMALLLTAPDDDLMAAGRAVPDLRREADVLLRIAREDQFDRESLRTGEADLLLLANHCGPTADMVVAFQGHYRRFVDPSER